MKIKSLLSTVLIIIFSLLTNAHAITYEIEPNNDKDHANDLYNLVILQQPIIGQLSSATDVDYYSIHVSGPGIIRVQFYEKSNPNFSSQWSIVIEDSSGNTLAQKIHDYNSMYPEVSDITASVATAGEYFVRVKYQPSNSFCDAEYSLTVTATNPIKPLVKDPNSINGIYEMTSWITRYDNGQIKNSSQYTDNYGRLIATNNLMVIVLSYSDSNGTKYGGSEVGEYSLDTNNLTFYSHVSGTQAMPYQLNGSNLSFDLRGHDVNNNNFTSSIYLRKIENIYNESEIYKKMADFNGDGKVDMKDVILGLQILSRKR